MTRRSPARLLAPIALVTAVLALYLVVTSGNTDAGRVDGGSKTAENGSAASGATKTTKTTKAKSRRRTYTVKPGDTPSGIAERVGISVDTLLELNPKVDPQLLSPGQRLKLSP